MAVYVPGTEETDQKKQNMSLQQLGAALSSLQSAATVDSFNGRTGAVTPAQGDYPASLIPGTTTNDNATAGNIGEYLSSTGGPVAVLTSTIANLVSRSLTAGDWDVTGTADFVTSSATGTNIFFRTGISTSATSNTLGTGSTLDVSGPHPTTTFGVSDINIPCATVRISLATTTTVYLNGLAVFGGGTMTASGFIRARRVR